MTMLLTMSPSKPRGPAKPSPEYRLAARVPMRMKEDVDVLVARLGRFKYRSRRLGIEGLLAAVVLEFLEMTQEAQAEILTRNLPRVEAAFGAEGECAPPEIPYATEEPDPPSRRKRAR